MNEEVKNYIKEQRNLNIADTQIRVALKTTGWKDSDLDTIFLEMKSSYENLVVSSSDLNIIENSIGIDNDSSAVKSKKPLWIKLILGIVLFVVLAIGALISRPLPDDSSALKNRALSTLMEKGEEVFVENGAVTSNGLCVFMIFNASYLEAVSDPSWEFQCFDSEDAFAGEVKLNDGRYRCSDSGGKDVKAEASVIYGPECLDEDDPRLDDGKKFSTSYVFFESDRVSNSEEEGNSHVRSIDEIVEEWDKKSTHTCGDFLPDDEVSSMTQEREGKECLSRAVIDGCELTSFKRKSNVWFVFESDGACKFGYAHKGGGIRSGECNLSQVLNYNSTSEEDLQYWTSQYNENLYDKAYRVVSQRSLTKEMSPEEISNELGCQFYN